MSDIVNFPPPPPPPPPPPVDAPAVAPAPLVPTAADVPALAGDAAEVASGPSALAKAVGGEYGDLPFEAAPPAVVRKAADLPPGEVRDAVVATATAIADASMAENKAFIDGLKGTVSDACIQDLQALATAGRLDAPDPAGGPNLRDSIAGFLGGGGDPKLAEAAIAQAAIPSSIQQIRDNTCTAAAAQTGWAAKAPAEFFRAATDLATKGTTTIVRDGKEVRLAVDEGGSPYFGAGTNQAAIAQAGYQGRDRIDAVVQAALMNLGSSGSYSLAADRVQKTTGGGEGGETLSLIGLSSQESNSLFGSLLDMTVASSLTSNTWGDGGGGWTRDCGSELDAMRASLAGGAPGAFALIARSPEPQGFWTGETGFAPDGPAAHAVIVVGMADGAVTYLDPSGAATTLPEKDFLGLMTNVDPARIAEGGIGGNGSYGTGRGSSGGRRGG